MNIEIKPMPPVPVPECEILINGILVGTMKELNNSSFKYQVIFKSKLDTGSIYQGFGNSYDAAMRDAIERNVARRIDELNELDKLENFIWGDYETN